MAAVADSNFLFGLLALQTGTIDQAALVAAFHAWTRDKALSMAEILLGQGVIDAGDRAALEALAAKHVMRNGGDIEKSVAAVPAPRSIVTELASIEITEATADAFLGPLADAPGVTVRTDGNPDANARVSMGGAVGNGQRFRVLRPHARGGLGAVFVAIDAELNREVALKQILDQHADDATSRSRFVVEAQITGGLEHPGIVPVYGLGHDGDGRPYYAMRFIRGESLKEAIDRFHQRENTQIPSPLVEEGRVGAAARAPAESRDLELRKLLRRFLDVCNAIDYAHSRGVIHRDIKPANIIVGNHGETLVVDWGLAKPIGRVEPGTESVERLLTPSSASGSAVTLPGSTLGTPAYMSPEQADGRLDRLGPWSDVYSLGATLYCLLTGKPPFEGDGLGRARRRAERRVRAAEETRPRDRQGLGSRLPQGDGPQAGGSIRNAPRPGRRHRALAGRRAGQGVSRAAARAPRAMDPSSPDLDLCGRCRAGRDLPGRDDRRRCRGPGEATGSRCPQGGPGQLQHGPPGRRRLLDERQ